MKSKQTQFVTDELKRLDQWAVTEDGVRQRTLRHISSSTTAKPIIACMAHANRILFEECVTHPNDKECQHTADQHVILYLGTRLFNGTLAFWSLVKSGYYMPAFAIQRDLIESGLLVQRFMIRPSDIEVWRLASQKVRIRKFGAATNRRFLEHQDYPNLYDKFSFYCEAASHPTPLGRVITEMDGRNWTGPHFNRILFEKVIRDMALNVVFGCDMVMDSPVLNSHRFEERESLKQEFQRAYFVKSGSSG